MQQNALHFTNFVTPLIGFGSVITSFGHIAMLTVRQYLVFTSILLAVNFQQNGVSKPYSTASGLIDAFRLKLLGCRLEY